jgi:nucleoside-diphosphate-sugar epimerase
LKELNLAALLPQVSFRFHEANLLDADLEKLLQGVDFLFHQAAQAGVRASWSSGFRTYVDNNILATQRLLEASRRASLRRFVFASSSSVYGTARHLPVQESELPRPVSPYGVTKLASEQLCLVYAENFDVPAVSLRYFTVYGPRQRPDMAFNRFIAALVNGREITIYGDGRQTRDFTFISDIVAANVLAAAAPEAVVGRTLNIGGGSRVPLNDALAALVRVSGREASVTRLPEQPGDARHTYADCSLAAALIGYRPAVELEHGLRAQWEWQLANLLAKP